MAGRFGRNKYKKNHEEFEEEDVWGVVEVSNRRNLKPMMMMIQPDYSSPANSSSSSPRMIPRSSSSSSSMNDGCHKKQFSAPVDIPDWSKIYGKGSRKKAPSFMHAPSSWVDVAGHHHNHHGHGGGEEDDDDRHVSEDDDGDGDDDGVVPPHEYIAKKLARSQISSFSVCEGMGRTLKGRDLRKVRNAILTRTGFLE